MLSLQILLLNFHDAMVCYGFETSSFSQLTAIFCRLVKLGFVYASVTPTGKSLPQVYVLAGKTKL